MRQNSRMRRLEGYTFPFRGQSREIVFVVLDGIVWQPALSTSSYGLACKCFFKLRRNCMRYCTKLHRLDLAIRVRRCDCDG